jgi:hypothetical protein
MEDIGDGLLKQLEDTQERLEELQAGVGFWTVGLKVVSCDATCIDRTKQPSFGLEIFLKTSGNDHVAVTVTQDDRGEGFSLYRRNDHPAVDFSKLEAHPDVIFAHKGGFIAKTKPNVDWRKLVDLALV